MTIDPDVRRLALSCLLLGFIGPMPPRWLVSALGEGLGGVVLFGSNLGDGSRADELTAGLRAAAAGDVVIALDEEGGDVTRLDTVRGSAFPGAAALGWLDDPAATEESYAATAARLAAAGVTVNLAPVADVNVEPRNPVIGVRSFGADPHLAARHVAAAVRGTQRGGLAACAKHFPGHGATSADSHHGMATVTRTFDEIVAGELVPFVAAIEAGTRAVMTGHLMVPALDPDHVATVSPMITTGILRDRLGFAGTILTDALEMKAIAATVGMVDGFVRALQAGADAIETGALAYPELVVQIPIAVQAALDDGTLTLDRLRDASRRTARLARPADPAAAWNRQVVDSLPQRCIETIGALPRLHRPLVLEARPPAGMASGELPWSIAQPLRALVEGTQGWDVCGPVDLAQVDEHADGRSLVVVVRDPQRHAWQSDLIGLARRHPQSVVVDVGWPADPPPDVATVRTRGVAPGLLAAAASVLGGAA